PPGPPPPGGLESIRLVDPHPRQLLPPPRELVAAPRELLLRLEQFDPRCPPLFTCPGFLTRHGSCLLPSGVRGRPVRIRSMSCAGTNAPVRPPPIARCWSGDSLTPGIGHWELQV